MSNSATVSRAQLTYGLCLPLAALIGFFLADPLQSSTVLVLSLVGAALAWPLFVRWHHALLIFSLNSAFVMTFLPGNLPPWMYLALGGSVVLVFRRCLDAEFRVFPPGTVGWSLVALGIVVLFTMYMRGGLGFKSLGSASMGGRKYIYLLLAIAAYFVVASRPISSRQALFYMGLFCLSGLTSLLSHAVYAAGGKFYWLYSFIDSGPAAAQVMADWDVQGNAMARSGSAMNAASALISFIVAWCGLKGTLNLRRPWRLLLLLGCLVGGLVGGFRSFLVGTSLLLIVLFFLEGLHRTRYLAWLAIFGLAGFVLLFAFSERLPASMQRAISFLPVPIDARVLQDAQGSSEWRLEMWRALQHEVPANLLVGKGYAIDPGALQMAGFNAYLGFGMQAEWAIITANYHNGPFSVIIPLGVWGALAFGWFLVAGFLRLRWFCRHGSPELLNINRALCAMFISGGLFFLCFFGSLDSDLIRFVMLLGLAECLNAGARRPADSEATAPGITTPVEEV